MISHRRKSKKLIVYKYTNKINGKVYIGITSKSLHTRHREHMKSLRDGTYFHNAIKKHGVDAFDLQVIDKAETRDELCQLEKHYIELYKSFAYRDDSKGYNCTIGGDGMTGRLGKLNSQYGISPKERMNEEQYASWLDKINNPSDETRRKISEAWKGNKYFLGKKHTEETKKKMSESKKGRIAPNKLKVKQFDLNGNYLATFNSLTEATQVMTDSKSSTCICMALKGNKKTAYGYIWKYAEGEIA